MLLKNAVVYRDDFEPASVNLEVNGERITSVDAADAAGEALDLTGCTVMPGFMDIHVHGCAGCDMATERPRRCTPCPNTCCTRGSPPSARPR